MKKISDINRNTLGVIGLVLVVILFFSVNIIAAFALKNYRLDLTQAKLYSLSEGSLRTVKNIKEPITIRFFLSEKLAKVSQIHATYAVRVIELLEQYASASDGKIKLQIIDPEPFSKKEDEALAYGLKGIPVGDSSEYVYIGLTLSNSSDRRRTIALLDPSRERFLEYDITKYLTDLTRAKRPTIGIISTLPIDGRGEPQLMYPKYLPRWAVMNVVRDIFDVRFISRHTLDIPQDIDVLMLVNPKKFYEETMYAIDQYLMGGGNMLMLLDPFSETEAGLGETSYTVYPEMDKLLNNWGVSFDPKRFVADMTLARTISRMEDGKTVQMKFLPWLAVNKTYLSPEDPVTNALNLINMAYAGSFSVTKKVDGLTATPLIFSSKETKLEKTTFAQTAAPANMLREFKSDNKNRVLGLRIKGTPHSAFDKAPVRNFLKQRSEAHIEKATTPVNIILIADSDFLADKFWTAKNELLGVEQLYPFAANADLLINALDNLSGATSLIDLRSKAEWRRPFTVIENMQLNAGRQYRAQETILFNELQQAQSRLKKLTQQSSGENRELLSSDDKNEIRTLQKHIISLRAALRAVQTVLSRDILTLQTTLILVNVLFVPALLVIIALFVAWRRRVRRIQSK
ncbi:MAG: GldG family protein [Alphaproteobacteria bacterium]|nr:GldG family protein [Alphaproteobacteria bacterium]